MMLNVLSPPKWKQRLRENFTRLSDLADFLELSDDQREKLLQRPEFAFSLPRRLAEKMAKGTLDDPLFRQFVPLKEENNPGSGFVDDPVSDQDFQKTAKLLHKYKSRVLLMPTSACAMHCRYCFRQNYPYESTDHSFEEELEYIAMDRTIEEVILSGGDPLSLTNESLASLVKSISSIDHVKRIRFHSRFIVGIPERIDEGFLDLLQEVKQQVIFVVHSNHPREIDEDVQEAFERLRKNGAVLLCQSVLLKGVNDHIDTLVELCTKLVNAGVIPYYLHQLDRVRGSQHFEVSKETGRRLIQELNEKVSGYAVFRYVQEIAHEPAKTELL